MMRHLLILLLSALSLNLSAAVAGSGGVVEAIQMPAWYDRDGKTYPLKPGIKLISGDIIRTGNNSRALLRLDEGSMIKLGSDAKLKIKSLAPPKQKEGIFAALLRVSRGAFRFTTTELGKNRKRDVDVRIGAVTIGIRGTDIWGRSKTDGDLFCLIEGNVNVQRDGEAAFVMRDPLQYIVAEKDKPTSAVMPVDMDELGGWAAETETQQGKGIVTADGEWAVNMISLRNAEAASKLQQVLNDAGYATGIEEVEIDRQLWLRLRIKGFVSRKDASSFAETIDNQYGLARPWVVKF